MHDSSHEILHIESCMSFRKKVPYLIRPILIKCPEENSSFWHHSTVICIPKKSSSKHYFIVQKVYSWNHVYGTEPVCIYIYIHTTLVESC